MKVDALKSRLSTAVVRRSDASLRATAATLWDRFQKDRLPLTASSLTYTTVLALVPLLTVVLSVFTAFPMFSQMEGALQEWLVESLIPAGIAENLMSYLTQFASKASQLGVMGIVGLTVTSLSLMLTIDKTLNQIWRVSDQRSLGQRVLVYWAALTLGPLVLGASLAISSYIATASRGWLPDLPGSVDLALVSLQFSLMTGGLTLLYRFVPNTPVRWKHALVGALFVTICLSTARWGLGIYLSRIPTYSVIYGAFAVLPILLLWIYVSWMIVLLGAAIVAYLPSLLSRAAQRANEPGWQFALALDVLQQLAAARETPARGLRMPELVGSLKIDPLQLAPVLSALQSLDWVGELATRADNEDARHVLLVEPQTTPLAPLVELLLLAPDPALDAGWQSKPLASMAMADILPRGAAAQNV